MARTFSGRAQAARPALINGAMGLVWAPGSEPRVAFGFTIAEGRVVAIDMVADPDRLRQLDLALLDWRGAGWNLVRPQARTSAAELSRPGSPRR